MNDRDRADKGQGGIAGALKEAGAAAKETLDRTQAQSDAGERAGDAEDGVSSVVSASAHEKAHDQARRDRPDGR